MNAVANAPAAAAPLVSIGVPVRNGAQLLPRALRSLARQTYRNIEVIVVDNGSEDDSGEVAQSFADADPRFSAYRNSVNIGARGNFLRTLELATGEFFMWAAHDDEWDPRYVAEVLNRMTSDPSAVVGMSQIRHRSVSGVVEQPLVWRLPEGRLAGLRLALRLAGGSSEFLFIYGLFRTEFARRAARHLLDVPCADALFVAPMALAGTFAVVDEPLLTRHVNDVPWARRYPDEPAMRRLNRPTGYLRTMLIAGPVLIGSKVIPPGRRWMAVPVAARMIAWLARIVAGEWRRALFPRGGRSTNTVDR